MHAVEATAAGLITATLLAAVTRTRAGDPARSA